MTIESDTVIPAVVTERNRQQCRGISSDADLGSAQEEEIKERQCFSPLSPPFYPPIPEEEDQVDEKERGDKETEEKRRQDHNGMDASENAQEGGNGEREGSVFFRDGKIVSHFNRNGLSFPLPHFSPYLSLHFPLGETLQSMVSSLRRRTTGEASAQMRLASLRQQILRRGSSVVHVDG